MKKDEIPKEEPAPYEESEPYLGPAWAVVMLILYVVKETFPTERFTILWWIELYVICIVIGITVFTLVKRHKFFKAEQKKKLSKKTP